MVFPEPTGPPTPIRTGFMAQQKTTDSAGNQE